MLNPRHRSEQGSGRRASLEEDCTLCVFFGVFLAFGAAASSPSSSSSSSPPACSFGSMTFFFAADSCAFANFEASQGTITECADLNYSISTQAQQLKQHTISINLICKYQLHACINYPFGGMGSKGEISRRKPSLRKIQSSASVHQPSIPAPASQPVCHIYHLQRCAVERSDSVHSQLPAIK